MSNFISLKLLANIQNLRDPTYGDKGMIDLVVQGVAQHTIHKLIFTR